MKTILITGYPKSGNTWLTRLIAELLDSPVKGFYQQPKHNELAIEGQERQGNYVIYKGHQSFYQIKNDIDTIVYCIRHVGDVIVSGANYFIFPPYSFLNRFLSITGNKKYCNFFGNENEQKKIKKMINVAANGSCFINGWLRISWDNHIQSFFRKKVIFVKYEDMIISPVEKCIEILSYIGYDNLNQDRIKKIVKKQSFEEKKKMYQLQHNNRHSFLREGKIGQWKEKLNPEQKIFIEKRFHPTLLTYDYVE